MTIASVGLRWSGCLSGLLVHFITFFSGGSQELAEGGRVLYTGKLSLDFCYRCM